jgi:hypothetical protein
MKFYISSFNGILDDLRYLVGPTRLTTPREADAWVLWQDVLGSYGDLIKACNKTGWKKPCFTVQHGRAATLDYAAPNSFPLSSDYFLAWGTTDFERMKSLGYGDRTKIVGCPLNAHIKPRIPHEEKVVLFVPVNTGKEEPENIAAYYELLKLKYDKAKIKVLDNHGVLKEDFKFGTNQLCQDFDVVAKLLPSHKKELYHGRVLTGQQDTFRNNQLVFELLRNVDAVVGLDEGCTEIFAFAHDVPVFVVDGFKYRQHREDGRKYVEHDIYRTKAATHVKLEDLKDALEYGLAHQEHKREERAEVAEAEMGISIPAPTRSIHTFVRQIVRDGKSLNSGVR